MFEKLENLINSVDDAVATIYEAHLEEIRCRPGCADCCHAVFDISFIEAAYIASFLAERRDILESQQERARNAAEQFEALIREGADISAARIRCPLLGEDNLCLAHLYRPLNCRTYGTPTVIEGKAHVCGLSGFDNRQSYPTVNLAPLQQSLQEYSIELVGPVFGIKRFPIAWVILKLEYFLPR